MAAIHCVFQQLATWGVKILLNKLAEAGITQTKTKTDILTRNKHFEVEQLAVALLIEETSYARACFLNIC